eukprot:symbB.v1.2.002527.t1/scaffold134.1/size305535/11
MFHPSHNAASGGLKEYFGKQYAGQKDEKNVQTLKGSCREFEAECVWGYIGWQLPNISHLRLGFYTADIFAPEPTQQRDVLPVLRLLEDVKPDVTWQKFGGKDP